MFFVSQNYLLYLLHFCVLLGGSFSPVVRKLVQPMQVGFQIGSLLKFRSLIRLDSLVESLVALNDTISSRW